MPIAQYAIDTGDTATLLGDTQKAKQQYFLASLAYDTSRKSGVNTDLERSLFESDHDIDLVNALAKAQNVYVLRPSIYGADVLAWALFKNKKYNEAQKYSQIALRLGGFDSQILFHAGMIEKSNNNPVEAKRLLEKAIMLNPNYSILHSRLDRQMIQKL